MKYLVLVRIDKEQFPAYKGQSKKSYQRAKRANLDNGCSLVIEYEFENQLICILRKG